MADTPSTKTPLIPPGTLDVPTAVNAALEHLDGLVQAAVIAIADDPPVSPADGDQYLVGTGAGEWLDKNDWVARYVEAGDFYKFYEPGVEVREVVNLDAFEKLAWNGFAWAVVGGLGDAPSDGSTYGRKDGAWVVVTGGGSTQGKQAIYVSAAAMRPSSSGGCAALAAVATSANQPDLLTLDFDSTTQEYAQFSLVMPKKWNEGTITFIPHWSHAATVTNFGVVWSLQAVAVGNDDAIGTSYGTGQNVADIGGTTNDLYIGPESSAITIGGTPAAEEMIYFRVSRVTGDASDTMSTDARLHGLTVYVTTDADTDA